MQFVTFSDFISKTKLKDMNTLNSPFITVYVFFKLALWQHYFSITKGDIARITLTVCQRAAK